jgi:hypothetical protein
VTTAEPRSDQDQKPVSAPQGAPLAKRLGDWFWRGSALAKARQALPELGERSAAFARRARAAAELAQNMLAADEPGEASSEGSACENYRQSSYWALCALLAKGEPAFQLDDSERVWGVLDDALLVQSASEDRVESLRSALRSGSFVYFAELPASEQAALLIELRKLAQALLVKLDERSITLDAIYLERAWRLGLLALLLLCVALTPAGVKKLIEARSELIAGKAWRTSSKLDGGGCTSPAQTCTESPSFFFHTAEESSPWVEFDLGANRKISKVRVDNRLDCCADRANPIVVEVSTDQKHWRKASRHDGEFTSWEAEFAPVEGRYLRVRALKQTYLHLASVRAY